MVQPARYVRLFADAAGESHFEDVDLTLLPADFAPPAPPLHVAPIAGATQCFFLGGPPDWPGDIPHPTPRRQLFCTMHGEYEVTASDGTVRRFAAGSVLLLEDTTGKGHSTRFMGEDDVLVLAVALSP